MHRKTIKSSRYLSAFALTIIIFLIGFIIGGTINDQKIQRIYDLENDIRVQSLGNELVFELISDDLCGSQNLSSYTEEITNLGKKLTYMESIYSFDDPKVQNLKNYYSLLLVRHWIINEDMKEKCGLEKSNVLYFYTNYGECEDCEDQGLVLTNVHKNYPFFNTYSFEYYEDNPAINFLKEKYELSPGRLPTLIVDDEVFYGFQSKSFLLDKLELQRLLTEDKVNNPQWYS